MPIDPGVAIGASLPEQELTWEPADVIRYHLALGAGARATDPGELRYVVERDLHVLPTFVVAAPETFGLVAPARYRATPPEIHGPGIELDLQAVVQGGLELVVHRRIPMSGHARARARIADVYDKRTSAVIVQEIDVAGVGDLPLVTARSTFVARGEGDFCGMRGPRAAPLPSTASHGEPDLVLDTPTLPQHALLYRMCGDRSPLHADPELARAAGFPMPILQGLCTYGMVCKAVVDALLGADPGRVRRYAMRFTGVVFPGETLRTRVWAAGEEMVLATSVLERDDAPALAGTMTATSNRPALASLRPYRPRSARVISDLAK